VSDPAAALLASWGQATSAWWSLMAGSWTAADALVRAILESSYEEASISRVNTVQFDLPAGVDMGHLDCGQLTRVGPGPPPKTISGAQGTVEVVSAAAASAAGTPRVTLTVKPAGAATGDYVAPIRDTSTNPPTVVGRVVVFVIAF
jgi:hypothetical protein